MSYDPTWDDRGSLKGHTIPRQVNNLIRENKPPGSTVNSLPPSPPPAYIQMSNSAFRVQSRAVLLTWSSLAEEPTTGLVARFEAFCRGRPNHWQTLAIVERHDPTQPDYDPARPLHVHALTISVDRRAGWNTRNPRFWDFEGSHPNIALKDLREGPGGCAARTAFHYLWKDVGEHGEEVKDLMAGELTEESLEGILEKGSGGKRSRAQAELEDGLEIVAADSKDEFYQRFKQLRPL
ncbi:hypothetical protein FRC08_016759 [Ceratobasidium sp. 394]|nr:hypothetical protein FRC08_016759 [Ceratobasidium sp. 394]